MKTYRGDLVPAGAVREPFDLKDCLLDAWKHLSASQYYGTHQANQEASVEIETAMEHLNQAIEYLGGD